MPPFQYSPVNTPQGQIRILGLQPGPNDSPLYATLEPIRLATNPEYEALSYTWGNEDFKEEIQVNGSPLEITLNLYNALRSLRYSSKERRLWVDGICVNQEDVLERAAQVKLFKQVYTQASRVVTYIGENDAKSDRALDLANQISEYTQRYKDHPNPPDLMGAIITDRLHQLGFPRKNDPIWEDLRKLFRREWASRAWIFQESVLNQHMIMYCGRRSFSWLRLPNIIWYAQRGLAPPLAILSEAEFHTMSNSNFNNTTAAIRQANLDALHLMRRDLLMKGEKKPLLDLLEWCMRLECRDARDKVYSLLGVASDASDLNIVPNYKDNNRPQHVYAHTTVRIIENSGSLDVLSNVKPKKRLEGLQSWVPDFSPVTGPPVTGLLYGIKRSGNHPYLASGNATASIGVSGNSITLQARVIDTIVWRSATMKNVPEAKDREILQSWHSKVRASKQYGGGSAANEAFWRTLIANVTSERKKATASCAEHFAGWCGVEELQFTQNWPGESDAEGQDVAKFAEALLKALFWRRFCMTEERYACLAPSAVENGDLVCLLKGARTPFIIRQMSSNFMLVGEAYVHGLMRGEGLNIPGTKWESFKIF